jgi:nitrite reductase/ring-hydroxylating ferredoxin subunit
MNPEATSPLAKSNPSSAQSCAETHHCVLNRIDPAEIAAAQSVLSRRSFVRTFALLSAASWVSGKELKSLLVGEISAQASTLPGIFRMNLDNFAALRGEVGSVRLTVTGMPATFRQIIVSRLEGSQFFAVTSQCTHEGNPVSAMNTTSRRLVCPTHGSQFAPNGALLLGPASRALTSYKTTFDGDKMLSIEIPGLGFVVSVTSALNPSNNQSRMRFEFPTVSGIRYNVQFRSSLGGGAWTAVPFANAIDAAASLMTLTGNNAKATVFVDPTSESGFYAIGRGVT